MKDINGIKVNIGDKIRGFGTLKCNGNFQIDLTPEVTVNEDNGVLRFGKLSASSFIKFEIVESNGKRLTKKSNEPLNL